LVLFGLALVLVGILVWRSVLAFVRAAPPESPVRRDTELPIGLCVLFIVIGVLIFFRGAWMIVGRWRAGRLAAAHPGEPWFADFPWQPEGWRERPLAAVGGLLFALLLPVLLALPFNYWMFAWMFAGGPAEAHGGARFGGVLFFALLVLVDLGFVAMFAFIALRIARKLRYGGSFILYDRFPFFLGGRLDVRVGSAKLPPTGVPITATLRFFEERFVSAGFGSVPTYHALYADEQVLDSMGLTEGSLRLSFPLPTGDYASALSGIRQRFWYLDLHATTGGADFRESLLVPIYDQPPGA
jgi:hypothetical protein